MFDFTLLAIIILAIPAITKLLGIKPRIGFWICIIILATFSALRGPDIGNDTQQYIQVFKDVNKQNIDFSETRYEIGYLWMNKIIGYFTNNYQWLFIVYSIFIFFSVGRFIEKYSRIPWLSLFLFFTYGFFNFSFTAVRQAIAISCLLFSFDFIKERKFLKFAILVSIASLFHTTAILFITAYIAVYIKPSWRNFTYIILAGTCICILFSAIFGFVISYFQYYEHYSETTYIGEAGLANSLYIVISSLIWIVSYTILKRNSQLSSPKSATNRLCLILVALAVAIYIISLKANIFDRLALYFNIFSIILLPNAISRLSLHSRIIIEDTVIIAFYIYAATILLLRPGWNSIYPYTSCF